ncbi:hypothetical protein ACJX0J_042162, partial [Zea mays]
GLLNMLTGIDTSFPVTSKATHEEGTSGQWHTHHKDEDLNQDEKWEQLVHLLKGIAVETEKFQATPLSQEVLIVWGDHDQQFPVEKAFVVH